MGFEVIYHYYEQNAEGNYDKDNPKQIKKKIGSAYEEVSLAKLASAIMTQRARRDILIFDQEIYEYQKHKINFKDTNGGIVVKGRKFTFEGEIEFQEEEEEPEIPKLPKELPHNKITKIGSRRPIKYVTLDPDVFNLARVKGTGYRFSIDKEYAVYQEKLGNMLGSSKYLMQDDSGREIEVSSDYFLPARIVYEKDDKIDKFDNKAMNKGPKLTYENEILNTEVPRIR